MNKKIIQYALMMLAFVTITAECSDYDEGNEKYNNVEWFPLGAEWRYSSCPQSFYYTVVKDSLGFQIIEGLEQIGSSISYKKSAKILSMRKMVKFTITSKINSEKYTTAM